MRVYRVILLHECIANGILSIGLVQFNPRISTHPSNFEHCNALHFGILF